jgi:hypothetical protein
MYFHGSLPVRSGRLSSQAGTGDSTALEHLVLHLAEELMLRSEDGAGAADPVIFFWII